MKRLYLSIWWALLLVLAVSAKEVTLEQAKRCAAEFMRTRGVRSDNMLPVFSSTNAYYIFNLQPDGWVIISADDVVTPVLGYSTTGRINENFLPDNMRFILKEYETQIKSIARVVMTAHQGWTNVAAANTRASGQAIEPLIQVNWNQPAPFNAYCPKQTALVGCVAVAMGQAMSVQQWPPRPKGGVSYTSVNYGGLRIDFDAERAYNWGEILQGANNYDETARLLYHAGMSVRMSYGEDGSGIPSNEANRISEALIEHFSYPNTVSYHLRDYYKGDWEQLLINELNAGRAVIYNAIDTKNSAGHSFNVDGYDGKGHFHVNWGWGGYGNGNFSIDNLRDAAMNMDYDAYHIAVVGIGAPDQVLKNISLSHSNIEEGLPAGAVVGSLQVNGENPKSEYEINVHGTYDSGSGGYKSVPFFYENGLLKTTEKLDASTPYWEVEISVKDVVSGEELTQGFRVKVDVWKTLEETTSLSYNRITRRFKLTTKHNVSYLLKSSDGLQLQSGVLEPLPELEIDATSLPVGENQLELKCAEEMKTIRIISKK